MVDAPKVLVLNVDDYDAGRYARTQVLKSAGFEVKEATTGEAALRMSAAEKPDVVLLDVNLPDINGFEVCQRLKADPLTSSLPVLHLSATFVAADHRVVGLEGGADAYLTEPVEPTVLIATIHSLLRMRRAEDALRGSALEWQSTFDAIADGVAVLSAEGLVVRCNAAFPAIFGIPVGEIVGRPVWELWRGAIDREHLPFPRMLKSLRRETLSTSLGQRAVHVTVDPMFGPDGALSGAVYIVTDVTDRHRAEQERAVLLEREQAARAEAEAASHAKDDFLATLSHELRAPLNVMLGWARLLRRGSLDAAATDQALETIERNVKLQTQLIEDLLDVSRIVAGKLRLEIRPTDLETVINAALDVIRPAAEAKGIALDAKLDPTAGPMLGDAGRLQQIIWNLLSNAVKFTPRGGRVGVALERTGLDLRIVITDTGQGIKPEFLPHVFERFRQAEMTTMRAHGGLGLGLAIVRHLVDLHGGTVRAQSAGEGKGATFTVTLPLRATGYPLRGMARPGDAPAEADAPSLAGLRVLLVDDETDARRVMTEALAQCGAEVLSASSAREALAMIDHQVPDVLVSDIGMPGEDGYELIRRIRTRPPDRGGKVPAIALTAYARREDQERALASGYQVHVGKPIELAALARAIVSLTRP